MARWRLTQKHYLNVPGTEWEYKEISQSTGRQVRKVFKVPQYLDPDDPTDCNYPLAARPTDRNELIVAHAKGAEKADIIFIGDPTPDMTPLDEEAEAISAGLRAKWGLGNMEVIGEEGYSGALLSELCQTLNAFNASAKPTGMVVDDDKFNKLMEMNMALIAKLDAQAPRRV